MFGMLTVLIRMTLSNISFGCTCSREENTVQKYHALQNLGLEPTLANRV